jgi:hypothetical protein
MPQPQPTTVADIHGPWVDPDMDSGLIQRCKLHWNTPVTELTNAMLATYLRQRFALSLLVAEARKRIAENFVDDTELYEQELEEALQYATANR